YEREGRISPRPRNAGSIGQNEPNRGLQEGSVAIDLDLDRPAKLRRKWHPRRDPYFDVTWPARLSPASLDPPVHNQLMREGIGRHGHRRLGRGGSHPLPVTERDEELVIDG